MKLSKRFISSALLAAIIGSLAACGNETNSTGGGKKTK